MENKETKPTQNKEELLKAVADVLEEALAEYEQLTKMDVEGLEMAADPSRPIMGEDQAEAKEEGEEEKEPKEEDQEEKPEAKEAEEKEEEPKKEAKEDDESDEQLAMAYKSLTAKMEKRGMFSKSEAKAPEAEKAPEAKVEEIKKSEPTETKETTTPVAEDKTEALTKSFNSQIETLTKTVQSLTEKVEKIAAQPAPRKGVAGYAPLKKNEGEEQPLNKAEAISKLLELRKSGDKRVDTTLINRIETGRMSPGDFETLKGILE